MTKPDIVQKVYEKVGYETVQKVFHLISPVHFHLKC
jgi:hypothetical protein